MRTRVLVLVLVCVLLGEGIAAPAPTTAKAELAPLSPEVRVTVGMKRAPSDCGLLIGSYKGYYKDLDIRLEEVQFNTGLEESPAGGARRSILSEEVLRAREAEASPKDPGGKG